MMAKERDSGGKTYVKVGEVGNFVGADLVPVDTVTTILGVTTHGA
jgi:hypothetical protein